MSQQALAFEVRSRIVGVLLRDARLARNRSAEECARALGQTVERYTQYELGQVSPSLPELEVLAYLLDVPIRYFWGNTTLSEQPDTRASLPGDSLISVRTRIVGTRLRQARQALRIRLKEFAAEVGLPAGTLSAYEHGLHPIPLPLLEYLASRLRLDLDDLLDSDSVVGEWQSAQRAMERIKELPLDLRDFLGQNNNEPFLRLAQRMSQMPVDQLRGIAAGLLEITL